MESLANSTNELKYYSDKPVKQKSVQRVWKSKEFW